MKKIIKATVMIIDTEEFVNDKSIFPDFISIMGMISNCSKGLCFSPEVAII